MRILHITPTYFGSGSVVGGGERYAFELARSMARTEQVVFLSFSDRRSSYFDGPLRVEHIPGTQLLRGNPLSVNPWSHSFFAWTQWADTIHCHQAHTLGTDLAIVLGRLRGKRVFVTDLGGGHRYAPSHYLPIHRWVSGFLLISDYSERLWKLHRNGTLPGRSEVIYGGVDCDRFKPGESRDRRSALFVGRLLPHKGIDYLIDAVGDGSPLDVVGRVYDRKYYDLLLAKSAGKPVRFIHTAGDDELVQRYRQALVTVLPSVYENCYGVRTEVPELLGLVALESMACGTPVIVSDVASLPEVVEDCVTGFLVPPNDPVRIRERISLLRSDPGMAAEMGRRGRERVLERFTWDAVAQRCLAAYRRSDG